MRNWNEEYSNEAHIPNGESFLGIWESAAEKFRQEFSGDAQFAVSYADHPRAFYDVFYSKNPRGALVFVHGGYWRGFDISYWSHLAKGAIALGYDVYLINYPLSPEVQISQITSYVAKAVSQIAKICEQPLVLCGHSAGGHLVARMMCTDVLSDEVMTQIQRVVSISGLFDLRPLMNTTMNDDFRLNLIEARDESPALLEPISIEFHAIVGRDERPEFLRQNALIANVWGGFELPIFEHALEDCNHFTVLDGMQKEDSILTQILVGSL